MLTEFNDFWHTVSWRNLTLVDCKFAHLTWENATQYLAKIKYFISTKVHCFPRRKWVALKRTGCVVWQNKWKQCYRECSKWPPCAWTHAFSCFCHWSVTSSTTLCCSPAQVSTSRCWKMTFSQSPGIIATVCGWGGQTYNLLMSSFFRIQCAKND